ncbi:hypothetical protein Avbf_15837 [Armadillidium vulgare]|nr:hypothetical protein Avbf_15837 [Armadillidium vulgare]
MFPLEDIISNYYVIFRHLIRYNDEPHRSPNQTDNDSTSTSCDCFKIFTESDLTSQIPEIVSYPLGKKDRESIVFITLVEKLEYSLLRTEMSHKEGASLVSSRTPPFWEYKVDGDKYPQDLSYFCIHVLLRNS